MIPKKDILLVVVGLLVAAAAHWPETGKAIAVGLTTQGRPMERCEGQPMSAEDVLVCRPVSLSKAALGAMTLVLR